MTTLSRPVNISKRPKDPADETDETPGSLHTPYGTPDVALWRAQYAGNIPPNIPMRMGSPALRAQHSDASLQPGSFGGRRTPQNGADTPLDLDNLTDEEKVRVLRRHLVSKMERQNHDTKSAPLSELDVPPGSQPSGSQPRRSSFQATGVERADTEPFPIPYHAPGADVTHDIYKWQSSDQRKQTMRGRAASLVLPRQRTPDPAFEHIHEPGGFRRNYVLMRATERGGEEPLVLNNFIEFLYIFGHFAGEDLEEDEGTSDEEMGADDGTGAEPTEETSLLRGGSLSRSRTRSMRNRSSLSRPHGNASVGQAYLMLLKAFVGTGVLFVGKAFYHGGILFSSFLFVFIAVITLYSYLLLLDTKFVVSGSFGDIGGTLYGAWLRYLILASIIVSQVGFVCAYIIFIAQNLQALVMGLTHCVRLVPIQYLIAAQLVVFLPLALVRDLAKLSSSALIGDAFILIGLVYIFGSEISLIRERGIADIQLFNPKDFSLFVGVAVYSFEGIGMIIPVTDAMREPRKLPKVLTGVVFLVTVLFGGAGALAYLAFGSDVQPVVLVNLNTENPTVQLVQFFYSLAIMLSVPLQMFPATRIMENGLFTLSGKANVRVKWMKNMFRFGVIFVSTLISWLGAADLDKFVAFIGCFACVPLCYVYPAMLHYKACADTPRKKAADIAMIVFGVVTAAYTTVNSTVKLIIEPDNGGPPVFGNCQVPGA
ncbi:vacuolar amino acid transporter 4 [Mycena pura]|uniref:Vacuolar amino acid transporter 4 n=1 Tax=Mycena pura TaxID=153505 RepID=A0AAD6VIY9_9AGAR|nr:vacuolar amino acid transporter 4 [Mycena pura]